MISSKAGVINRFLKLGAFPFLLFLVNITIFRGVFGLAKPYLHNYMENVMLVNSWGLVAGHGLYRLSELNNVPSFLATYPPIFYFIIAMGIKIWGITYVPGRIVVLCSLIGCAVLITLISRRRGADMQSSIMGGLLFLGAWPVYLWSRYLRVDFLAIFFELAAVYAIFGKNNFKNNAAFIIFALLAGYTKQTAFGLVAGSLLVAILSPDELIKRRGIALASIYAISAITIFGLIEIVTGGRFHKFVIGIFLGNMSADLFLKMIRSIISDPISFALITTTIIMIMLEKNERRLIPFVGIPFLIAISTIGKIGSGQNYFFETFAACSIAVSILLDRINKPGRRVAPAIIINILIILAVVSSSIKRAEKLEPLFAEAKYIFTPNTASPSVALTKLMRDTLPPGSLVLAQHSDLPLFANCVPAMSDPYTLTILAENGTWDPAPVVDAIRAKKVAMVLILEELTVDSPMIYMPREVAKSILENYMKVQTFWTGYEMYIPKQ